MTQPRLSLSVRCQVLSRINNVNVARAIAKQLNAREAEVELIQHGIAESLEALCWLRDNEARIKAALASEDRT